MVLSIPLERADLQLVAHWREKRGSSDSLSRRKKPLPPELVSLCGRAWGRWRSRGENGDASRRIPALADAVLNLLRQRRFTFRYCGRKASNPAYAAGLGQSSAWAVRVARSLCEKLLTDGPDQLQQLEKVLILSDAEVMPWLHRQAWLRPSGTLARFWQEQIRKYAL